MKIIWVWSRAQPPGTSTTAAVPLPAGPALAAAPLSVSRTESDVHRALYVPVRVNRAGTFTLRTGRLESGERIGLAFASSAALSRTLGPGQQWVNLCDESLRDMLAPLGIGHFRVDPLPLRVDPLPLGHRHPHVTG